MHKRIVHHASFLITFLYSLNLRLTKPQRRPRASA